MKNLKQTKKNDINNFKNSLLLSDLLKDGKNNDNDDDDDEDEEGRINDIKTDIITNTNASVIAQIDSLATERLRMFIKVGQTSCEVPYFL